MTGGGSGGRIDHREILTAISVLPLERTRQQQMPGLPAVAHPSLSSDLPAAKPGRPRRHDDRPTFSSVQGITTRLPRRRRTLALRRLAGAPGLTAATTEPDVSNTLCTPTMAIAGGNVTASASVR